MKILNITEFKNLLDIEIKNFLNNKNTSLNSYYNNEIAKEIILYTSKIIENGGKRIRPYLCYIGIVIGKIEYEKNSTLKPGEDFDIKKYSDLLIAIELFHSFALIHDDVIDRGKERHGLKTVQNHLSKINRYSEMNSRTSERLREGHAILAGDLVFSWVFEILSKIKINNELLSLDFNKNFYKMIEEVVLGQIFDVDMISLEKVDRSILEHKNLLKTAKYTFVHPLQLGYLVSVKNDIDNENTVFFREFGELLGLSYQIQDDLLDVIGDPKKTGKDNLSDMSDGQHTYLTQYIFERNNSDAEELRKYFGSEISENDKLKIIEIFHKSGSVDNARKIILEKIIKAESILEKYNNTPEIKKVLMDLILILKKRVN